MTRQTLETALISLYLEQERRKRNYVEERDEPRLRELTAAIQEIEAELRDTP